MDRIDFLYKRIETLLTRIETLKEQRFVRFANDECWIYQGDGHDYLESLVCPVVISAKKLMELIKS